MHSSSLGEQISTAQLEQRARGFLAAGRFRKARDDFKLLCKQDRAKYLSLLIQANVGLSREMITKGMTSEAQQVIAYLKTIASPADIEAVELDLVGRTGDTRALVPRALAALADPQSPLPETERQRLADQLVVAFEPLPTEGPTAVPAREASAVQEALRAASEQQWPRAAELLRPIPHGSPFGHWKLFVKGLAAFHRDEGDRARQCFEAVPPASVPGKMSRAYRLLAGPVVPASGTAFPDVVIETACRLAGQPGLGRPLARAEQLWRERQPQRSYQMLRETLTAFPSEGFDVFGALTEFYLHSLFTATERDLRPLVAYFDELLFKNKTKNLLESKLLWRTLALHFAPMSDAGQLKKDWLRFLQAHEKLHGPNPRLASLAHGWLGEQLSATRHTLFGFGRPQIRDRNGAIEALCKSIALDPSNLRSHLTLCELYGRLKLHSDRNRLLDQMTRRFPENKEVLIQAARGCLERNACKKGLQYLERVRQRDRLDPAIPELMVEGLLQQARQQFQQKRPELARQSLERAREFVVDDAGNLSRARWCVLTRHGLMEQSLGDPQRGEALLAEARGASPCPEAFLLYAHMSLRAESRCRYGLPTPFSQELARSSTQHARAVHATTLVRIFQHWVRDDNPYHHHTEAKLVCSYLRAASRQPFTREEARRLVEQAHQTEMFATDARKFVRATLKQDRDDPLFRLFDFILEGKHEFGNPETSRLTLQSIARDAADRGDHETVQRAERMIEGIKRGPLPPPDGDAFQDEPVEDEDLRDDAGLLPEDDPLFDELTRKIAGMSEAEFQKFRKSEAKRLPPGFFDMLMGAFRGRKPLPPIPPAPPITPPPPPKPDPNQMNLF